MLKPLFYNRLSTAIDRRQDPRLGFIVSVCALAQVDLLWKGVGEILGCECEDGIRWDARSGGKHRGQFC